MFEGRERESDERLGSRCETAEDKKFDRDR